MRKILGEEGNVIVGENFYFRIPTSLFKYFIGLGKDSYRGYMEGRNMIFLFKELNGTGILDTAYLSCIVSNKLNNRFTLKKEWREKNNIKISDVYDVYTDDAEKIVFVPKGEKYEEN